MITLITRAQIYAERLRREYDVVTKVGNPRVNYRETIQSKIPFEY